MSEIPGGLAILGGDNVSPLVEIGLGAVHKLCRLKGGGGGGKNCQFYLVKRRLGGGEGEQNLPTLRRHSLWTAPKVKNVCTI